MHMLHLHDDGRLDSVIPSPYGDPEPQLPTDYPLDSTPPRDPRVTFQRLVVHRVLDADLATIVDRLASANFIDRITWERLLSTGEVYHRDHLFAIKNDLCSWQPTGRTGYAEDDVLHIGEAVRLAALLYFRLRFGDQQEHKAPARTLALQLQQELMRQRGRSHIVWILYHGCYNRLALILWMLYCGGIFTRGSARKWFVDQIKGTAGIAGTNWSSTRAVLMKFMYNGEQCEAPMKKLFDESQMGVVLNLCQNYYHSST